MTSHARDGGVRRPATDVAQQKGSKLQKGLLAVSENSAYRRLSDLYSNNPVMRGLVQVASMAFPQLAVADAAVVKSAERMRAERMQIVFEELQRGELDLDEETVRKEEFLFPFVATLEAAIRTRRKEKAALLARLFTNAFRDGQAASDEFDEFLESLDSLSYRELQLLLVLSQAQATSGDEGSSPKANDNQKEVWLEFQAKAARDLQLTDDEIASLLTSVARTGFYEPMTTGLVFGTVSNRGRLTARFHRFAKWLQSRQASSLGQTT